MNLLNPIFLLGLGALAVPIVLHLIQRQRYPERPFTTLRFFDKTIKHNVIKRHFVDKLLLVLRVLLLAVLMLGLARPFGDTGIGGKRMSVVIVLDNSPSMGRGSDGTTLFDKAREAADALIEQLVPEDRAALVLSKPFFDSAFTTDRLTVERQLRLRDGQPTGLLANGEGGVSLALAGLTTDPRMVRTALEKIPPTTPVALCGYGITSEPHLIHDHAAVRAVLGRARPANASGQMGAAIRSAAELLADSKDGDRAILVLSDLQNSDWEDPSEADRPIDLAGITVRVVEIPPPADNAVNLSIENCRLPARKVRFGQRVLCTARIRNHGSAASASSTYLAVTVAGRKPTVKVPVPRIPPGASELISFPVSAVARGRTVFATVSVKCPGDFFAYDDTWHLQIPLRPPMRVLCVNAAEAQSEGERSGFFVVNALAPRTVAAQAAPFADVDECLVTALREKELFPYNVVILAGVDQLDEKARDRLRSFVEDGGGVLVFPGARPAAEEYNAWGILPAQVRTAKQNDFVYVQSLAERSPATAALAGLGEAAVQSLSASSWLDAVPEADAAVLGRFSNGSPSLVEGALGKGRVILAGAGCHTAWSDWPLRPAFVLLVRGLAWHLSDTSPGPDLSAERQVGEGIATAVPPEMLGGAPGAFRMELTGVSIEYEPLPWYRQNGTLLLPWTDQQGHFVLSVQPTGSQEALSQPGLGASVVAMAANHDVGESVSVPIASQRIKQLLAAPRIETKTLGEGEEMNVASLRTGRELWRWMAALALLAIFAEGLIAWRRPTNAAS